MSEKTFKVSPGEEIDIFIKRKKNSEIIDLPGFRRKGIIDPFSRDENLPRRLQKTGGLQFFDLGQILLEEVWTDNLFSADADITQVGNNIVTQDIQPEDYAAKQDSILETALENFTQKFKQIEKLNANKFYLQVRSVALNTYFTLDEDSERWTSDGKAAKFEDSELSEGINIRGNPFFSFARIGQNAHPDTAKITVEPDYEAEEIEFNVGKSDIYFLVPAFCNITESASGIFYPVTDRADIFNSGIQYSFLETLYANYLTFPRIEFDDYLATWFANNFDININFDDSDAETYGAFFENSNYLKSIAGTLFYKTYFGQADNGMGGTNPLTVTEGRTLIEFPFYSIFPAPPLLPQYQLKDDDISVQIEPVNYRADWSATSNPGALLAIIKQGNQIYYAWER